MKKFHFSLDRVLTWRRLQCEEQRAILDRLVREKNSIAKRANAIHAERRSFEHDLAHGMHFEARHVATLPHWQAQVKHRLVAIAGEQREADVRVAQAELLLRGAERAVKLLERLRERRVATWETELAREEEAFAAEAFLARCIRLRRAGPAGA